MIFKLSEENSLSSVPQLSNVSEKVWKRKGNKIFKRHESANFLKVEEQRVRKGISCSKSQ